MSRMPMARARTAAVLAGLCILLVPVLASASYRIESGDVLDINVLGAPGLDRHAAVDAGGEIELPILGEVPTAGLTLMQLRDRLTAMLIAKNVLRDPEVTVEVGQYRPVYIGGDVMKPGAYPFRVDMNVRDAIALAEGYDLLHLRGRDLMLEGADARGEYNGAGIELARQVVRIARIRAELAGATRFDADGIKDVPVKPDVLSEIVLAERQQLLADNDNNSRQKAYLERTIEETKDQLAAVTSAVTKSQDAYAEVMQSVARASDLLKQGLVAKERLEAVQSNAVAAQNSLIDVTGRAAQTRQDLANYTRQLQQVDAQRQISLLEELQRAVAAAATARSQLQAAAQKVVYTSAVQQQLASGLLSKRVTIAVFRGQQQLRADETTALQPGDDVQVTSHYDFNDLAKEPGTGDASHDVGRASSATPSPPFRPALAASSDGVPSALTPGGGGRLPALVTGGGVLSAPAPSGDGLPLADVALGSGTSAVPAVAVMSRGDPRPLPETGRARARPGSSSAAHAKPARRHAAIHYVRR
jgi:polysaccharide biosynthesis/export protein